ncbi:MAG: sigma-54-dependent Fis family transcriptional regulator [Sandaracinaceae bacterium]|nr:sigma-54-dependent Fis family transcriptional regulator [Sandaracinaceae bacterium]
MARRPRRRRGGAARPRTHDQGVERPPGGRGLQLGRDVWRFAVGVHPALDSRARRVREALARAGGSACIRAARRGDSAPQRRRAGARLARDGSAELDGVLCFDRALRGPPEPRVRRARGLPWRGSGPRLRLHAEGRAARGGRRRHGAKTLLILGPSGSGKEGLARCFHRRSGRAGSFVARNCGLFQRDLARSELFGAEKGAFSGCTQRIVGAVEAANQGTLFLDELGELPLDIQPMLLRFLDRGEYERMGRYGTTSVSDTLVVASTNKDLRAAAQRGEFRLDLWFRLAGDVVEVPPLRERYADIEAYLASRTNPRGESIEERLTPGARDLLASHRWDGNFRELMQFADRIEKRHPRERIDADACHDALSIGSLRPVERGRISTTPSGPESGSSLDDPFRRAEAAFREDHDALPTRWDDVKEFVENYLKPAVFASLAGATTATDLSAVELRTASLRVGADRGTAAKQLARYFDRYGPSGR